MKSKVYLVGAGTGAVELLTLKAYRLLQEADIVVYDALVSAPILALIPSSAKRIYVGKRAGKHAQSQEEINKLLVELAQSETANILRLKGGDPFVFGRGGEEMQALHEASIPYEIVSGITAGVSAPAYCGIPVTHRGLSQSVTFITAFTKEGGLPQLDWEALARLGGTLVFYMSMGTLPLIAEALQKHGLKGTTPAGIISEGTRPTQREHFASLQDFTADYLDYKSFTPALFIVGEVVDFAKDYAWFERGELAGQRILVTRSERQSSKLQTMLEAEGAEAILLPTISISPLEDNKEFKEAVHKLEQYTWLIFTSSNAVRIFMDKLFREERDVRALAHLQIACLGKTTKEALEGYSLKADFVPSVYTSQCLAEELITKGLVSSEDKLLIPQSKLSEQTVERLMSSHNIACESLIIYANEALEYETDKLNELFAQPLDWLTFCSSSAVHNFFNLVDKHNLRPLITQTKLAVIGSMTAQALESHGYRPNLIPKEATIASLVEAIKTY